MRDSDSLLELRHVSVDYGATRALERVDLALKAGEITTLIGPNGSGKTTLVRVVTGLLRPTAGQVIRTQGLRTGYVPQQVRLDETMPLSVIRFLQLLNNAPSSRIEAVLDNVGAGYTVKRPLYSLSGGEVRRVLLAQALLREPDLLVLDEPTAGMDVAGQRDLYRIIGEVQRRHAPAILLVSHDLHLVMAATDHVVCLNRHVCCAGHPDDVSRHPEYLTLFGPGREMDIAFYTHHHDHEHKPDGTVQPTDTGAHVG